MTHLESDKIGEILQTAKEAEAFLEKFCISLGNQILPPDLANLQAFLISLRIDLEALSKQPITAARQSYDLSINET